MHSIHELSPVRHRDMIASATPKEDKELLVMAAKLAREYCRPSPEIYWADMLSTAVIAYSSLAALLLLPFGAASVGACWLAVLAFYRGLSFIHELSHLRNDSVPGFAMAWNILFGLPLLVPSFMYDEVHAVHHSKTAYGTRQDPEYLPFAVLPRWKSFTFLVAGLLIPLGLLFRFAILGPASLLNPKLRALTVERYSALAINPSFKRRQTAKSRRAMWIFLECAASVWAIGIILMIVSGALPALAFGTCLVVAMGVTLINQFRTLASHAWTSEGDPITLTDQYLDSVNVPPPAKLPMLWAPVGLRYHALHHLLPSVPYHSLSIAHKRLTAWSETRGRSAGPDHASFVAVICPLFAGDRRSALSERLRRRLHAGQVLGSRPR